LAKNWSENNQEVAVLGAFTPVTFNKKGSTKIGAVSVFNLIPNFSSNHPAIFLINSLFSFVVSLLFIAFKRPDVTIVSLPTGDVGLGALSACSLNRVKSVVDYRDEWEDVALSKASSETQKKFYRFIKKFISRLYAKSCSTITVTHDFCSNLWYREVTNTVIMANGADTTVFYPLDKVKTRKKLNLAENDFVIVYSGIIGHYYKLDIVIKTLANIKDSIGSFKFLIAGEGPDLPYLEKLSAQLDLSANIIYLGKKENLHEVAEIISASDVGIIPGVYTKGQLSVKFFEYCSCGIPVIAIAPEDSIIAKLIGTYKVGLSIPIMDEAKIADAICKIYSDTSLRVAAGNRGRSLIVEKFDRNKTAEQYLDLIKRTCY
jgi:glycosyltransferase involved in cell wall biosynthesis